MPKIAEAALIFGAVWVVSGWDGERRSCVIDDTSMPTVIGFQKRLSLLTDRHRLAEDWSVAWQMVSALSGFPLLFRDRIP